MYFYFGGFLPPQSEARKKVLNRHKYTAEALIFFEAPHRLREMLQDSEEILGPTTETVVCRELTKPYEEIRWAPLSEIRNYFGTNEPRGEFVILFKGLPKELLNRSETESEVKRLLGYGRSASEILDELQPITELPRKELYGLITRLKE